jgi:hypothetical protein
MFIEDNEVGGCRETRGLLYIFARIVPTVMIINGSEIPNIHHRGASLNAMVSSHLLGFILILILRYSFSCEVCRPTTCRGSVNAHTAYKQCHDCNEQ